MGGRTTDSAHEAQRKLDQSTWVLLTVLLVGSIFTFLRGTLFNMAGERLVGERTAGASGEWAICCFSDPHQSHSFILIIVIQVLPCPVFCSCLSRCTCMVIPEPYYYIFHYSSCRLSPDVSWPVARIRRDLFERITIQDVGFFDQQKTGELMNRLASDTTGRPITMDA